MSSSMRIPLLFVFLWSTGYIGIEYCSAYVEPATFVVVRALVTATAVFFVVLVVKAGWPKRRMDYFCSSIVGILIHGVYGGGIFAAIYLGIDVGISALILSLQPMVTVLLSKIFLAEKMTRRKISGILLGFIGVSIVILEGNTATGQILMQNGRVSEVGGGLIAILLCFVALLGISSATIVQKRFCSEVSPFPGTCIQYTAAAIFMLPIALVFETMKINWNLSFVLGLTWLIIFVSIGAMCLLMTLIKHGDAGAVSSLLYLVTPLVVLEAWILFGDHVSLTSIVGMLLCMAGVLVVNYVTTAHSPKTKEVTQFIPVKISFFVSLGTDLDHSTSMSKPVVNVVKELRKNGIEVFKHKMRHDLRRDRLIVKLYASAHHQPGDISSILTKVSAVEIPNVVDVRRSSSGQPLKTGFQPKTIFEKTMTQTA